MDYRLVKTGINLGTKYLTPEAAYFLGLLCADEREVINGKTYWSAVIRHNPTHISPEVLEKHYSLVKQMAKKIQKDKMCHLTDFLKKQKVKMKKFNAGKKGIVTLFEQVEENFTFEDFITSIETPLLDSNYETIRSYIVGLFDGRGSYDNSNLIAVDFDNFAILELVEKCFNKLNIELNVNAGKNARKRENPKSTPRKNQFRVNYIDYLKNIGFVSIERFNKSCKKLNIVPNSVSEKSENEKYVVVESNIPLLGLKTIKLI